MVKVKSLVKSWLKKLGLLYPKYLNKREYESQRFRGINERSVEFSFVFKNLARVCPQTVLDVGTGATALPHLIRNCGYVVTATDNIRDYWPDGMFNRHYHIIQDDITRTKLNSQFDFITCVSVLEHIKDYRSAVKSMFSLLKPGGHLVISFPYNERQYVRHVYDLPDSSVTTKYPFITQAFSRSEIDECLRANNGKIIEQEYWQFFTGDYWTCGEQICPPVAVQKEQKHQISCLLIQKSV
jgi:SAM-dependent methyltransferase